MSQPLSPVLWYSQWGWGQFRISTFFSPKDFPTSDVFISWRRAALRYLSERPPAVERFGRSNRDRASGLWTVWHLIACFAVTAHIWIDSGLLCGTCNQRRRTRSRRFREDLRSWRRSRSKLGSLWSRSPNYGVLSCSFAAFTVDSNNSRPSRWNRDVTLQKRKALILCAIAFRNRNLDVLVAVHHNNQGDQDNFQASMRATADVVCVWTHLIMGCNNKTPWKWTQAKFVWNKKRGAGYPNAPCIIHLHQDGECLT